MRGDARIAERQTTTCVELTLDGKPCRNPASIDDRWCWRHAPPADEILGGPWDGERLRSWCAAVVVELSPKQGWHMWGTDALTVRDQGHLRGFYVHDSPGRAWRWARHGGGPADPFCEPWR